MQAREVYFPRDLLAGGDAKLGSSSLAIRHSSQRSTVTYHGVIAYWPARLRPQADQDECRSSCAVNAVQEASSVANEEM